MWLTLVALVVPLGLDTFAVAAALGISGLPRRDRLRVTLLFTAFETGMPLIGFLGGAAVGRAAGDAAELIAIAILIGLGAYILWPGAEAREDQRLRLGQTGLGQVGVVPPVLPWMLPSSRSRLNAMNSPLIEYCPSDPVPPGLASSTGLWSCGPSCAPVMYIDWAEASKTVPQIW